MCVFSTPTAFETKSRYLFLSSVSSGTLIQVISTTSPKNLDQSVVPKDSDRLVTLSNSETVSSEMLQFDVIQVSEVIQ